MRRAVVLLLTLLLAAACSPAPVAVATPSAVAAAAAVAAPLAVASPAWGWPVDAPHAIARPFIAPATPYGAGHRGIDIRAPDGTVYAPTAGIVSFAGVVVDRPVLSIRHPGGQVTSYEPVETTLVAGQPVRRGEVIGAVVAGHCASACLHFGVRLDGQYVSPLLYLGELPYSVLLPTRWPSGSAYSAPTFSAPTTRASLRPG